MAGSETSSTTVEWAMSELIKNPRVMEKAQNEIREVLKSEAKETVDEISISNMKYLKQVIKETLRLHPPVPFLVPRESMGRCQIQGYEIPAKARIFVNAWAIGRDTKYWTEPERFYPERFENSTIDYRGNHFELIPFGAGRRICPGLGQGMNNVELSLATMLYHFNWKLPGEIRSEDLNMDESIGITARRKHDLLVIPSIHPCSPLKQI